MSEIFKSLMQICVERVLFTPVNSKSAFSCSIFLQEQTLRGSTFDHLVENIIKKKLCFECVTDPLQAHSLDFLVFVVGIPLPDFNEVRFDFSDFILILFVCSGII